MGQITKHGWTREAKANLAVIPPPAREVGDVGELLSGCLLVQGRVLLALAQLTPPKFCAYLT